MSAWVFEGLNLIPANSNGNLFTKRRSMPSYFLKFDLPSYPHLHVKFIIGVNFINVFLRASFVQILVPKTTKLAFGFKILVPKISYKKCAWKTLIKLTTGRQKSFSFVLCVRKFLLRYVQIVWANSFFNFYWDPYLKLFIAQRYL